MIDNNKLLNNYNSQDYELVNKVRMMRLILLSTGITLVILGLIDYTGSSNLVVPTLEIIIGITSFILLVPLYRGAYTCVSNLFILLMTISFLVYVMYYVPVNREILYKYCVYILLSEMLLIIFTKSAKLLLLYGIYFAATLVFIFFYFAWAGKFTLEPQNLLIFIEVVFIYILATYVAFFGIRFLRGAFERIKIESENNRLKSHELKETNRVLLDLKETLEIKVKERTRELEARTIELDEALKIQYELNNVIIKSADELDKKNQELHIYATTDSMTGIFNRRTGVDILEKKLNMLRRKKEPLTIGFIDVNNLKIVNDTMGHKAGDELITTVAEIIKEISRESDTICRLGGDEFLLILPDCDLINANHIMTRIEAAIDKFNSLESKPFRVSISAGFEEYDFAVNPNIDSFIKSADEKMYAAKLIKKSTGKSIN